MWFFFLLAIVSLSPFDVSDRDPPFGERVSASVTLTADAIGSVRILVLHGVSFAPLGVLAAMGWSAGRRSTAGRVGSALLICLVPLLIIEVFQTISTFRHAHVVDLLVNVAGVVVGAWFVVLAMPVIERLSLLYGQRRRVLSIGGSLVVAVVFVALMVVPATHLLTLDTWDCDHEWRLGNEVVGERVFRGTIGPVALFDRGLGEDEIAAWMESDERALTAADALVSYDLGDCDGHLAGVEWGDDVACRPSEGLHFDGLNDHAVLSDDASMCTAMRESDAFSVAVLFRTDDLDQDGPARIVTLSKTFILRNFTIGQVQGTINFRVRHALAGPNGERPACMTTPVLRAHQWHKVVAVYDRGVSRVYVDSIEPVGYLDAHRPSVVVRAGITRLANLFGTFVWGWPLVVLVRWSGWRRPVVSSLILLLILMTVGWLTRWMLTGHLADWASVPWLVAAVLIGHVIYGWGVDGRDGSGGGVFAGGEDGDDDVGGAGEDDGGGAGW